MCRAGPSARTNFWVLGGVKSPLAFIFQNRRTGSLLTGLRNEFETGSVPSNRMLLFEPMALGSCAEVVLVLARISGPQLASNPLLLSYFKIDEPKGMGLCVSL